MDPRQRPARRTGDRPAGREIERSLVTRALENARLDARTDGTGEMRALLAVGHELAIRRANEHARVVLGWVGKGDSAADRDVVQRSDPPDLELPDAAPPPVVRGDPELAGRERQADEHHELHEVAALD